MQELLLAYDETGLEDFCEFLTQETQVHLLLLSIASQDSANAIVYKL